MFNLLFQKETLGFFMKEIIMKKLEALILECGGEYGLNHSKRLIKIVDLIADGKKYNKDIILFCSYTHDLGAFPRYAKEGIHHAIRSREVAEILLSNYNFDQKEQQTILEVIENHHNKYTGESFESVLFRDADALDFLGFIGIARDFSRIPKELKKSFQSIHRHMKDLPELIELQKAKSLAVERIKEMEYFRKKFLKESLNHY